jgi:carbamate kinase
LVVALGGHAIVPHGAAGTAEQQVATIERAMGEVATLVSEGFVEATGHVATIGPLDRADVLHGRSGTRVTRSGATVGAGR